MNGTARLDPASNRRDGVGLDHGAAEGRLQARRLRHAATLRCTATAGQAAQPQPQRGWLKTESKALQPQPWTMLGNAAAI